MKSFLILLALTLPVEAQHTQHAQHLQQAEVGGPGALREVGQSAFVAISERSTRLQDDPETDWSQVSIDRLRDHLVDMDLVFTGARQTSQRNADGLTFTLTGPPAVRDAIRRMLFAHSSVGDFPATWTAEANEVPDGASLRLTAPRQDHDQIAALGIFGLLADGDHHRRHHWMMATGQSPH